MPIDEARNMFGVADVTGTLKYGQCFIQYQIRTKEKRTYKVLKGRYLFLCIDLFDGCLGTVLVTKNPCLYPGDIRKLEAVDVPILGHCMRDCIVFPTVGLRPHSDEISGSDLDGDQYWVYWGNDLKVSKPVEPLAHSAAEKSIVPNITNEMVVDYYLNTVDHHCYSVIANVHTVIADQKDQGTLSAECVELATLFYRAIDSPKTGEIIDMNRVFQFIIDFCQSFPKFMMKFDQPYYESSSILEKLYLNAKKIVIKRKETYERYQVTPVPQRRAPSSTSITLYSELETSQSSIGFKYFIQILRSIWP